jgi:peptidoglycan/xylan/chitin deacetylase (PgdA/CDA1 family)
MTMADKVKTAIYALAKRTGLFALARRLTRKQLRILCYHGTSMRDESAFRPGLFIDPDVFEKRLQTLRDQGFPVLELGEALTRQEQGTLPDNAVVITIDDGFYSTYRHAMPALQKHGFPATVYVTSYYCGKNAPVFRLAVQYLFWAARAPSLELGPLGLRGITGSVDLTVPAVREQAMWTLINHGESALTEDQRQALTRQLALALGVDFEALVQQRLVGLMTPEEVTAMARAGVDVQLHTHRHRLPHDRNEVARELSENRAFLEPLVGKKLDHLCYPSGLWTPEHWHMLQEHHVASATTCEPGLNDASTPRLALKRFLDGAEISELEFEAELHGFSELLRRARSTVKTAMGRTAPLGKTVDPHAQPRS